MDSEEPLMRGWPTQEVVGRAIVDGQLRVRQRRLLEGTKDGMRVRSRLRIHWMSGKWATLSRVY